MFIINQEIVDLTSEKLRKRFGEAILAEEVQMDMPVYTVKKEIIADLLRFLYDDETLKYRFLTTLCGIHYPDSKEPFGVIYHLHSLENNQRIRIKTFTTLEDITIPSATSVFAGANWMERETYDFYGILFSGHPNLKRILNVDSMDYFPMRKEYPLEDGTREDKKDEFFGR
ncbi:MAG: NADH-quinone oxidoreductase subunit C [Bacteroidota bacterium]|nr:NADH-quinone oxidoreductase subunit C [Bacteroidota bacterium]